MRHGLRLARHAGLAVLLFLPATACAAADFATPGFPERGPFLRVEVVRSGESLPLYRVPYLDTGDRIRVNLDLPSPPADGLFLVVAWLPSNGLPGNPELDPAVDLSADENWHKTHEFVARQGRRGIMFFAPKPGWRTPVAKLTSDLAAQGALLFNASNTLALLSAERDRLAEFVAAVRAAPRSDAATFRERTTAVAGTLGVHVKAECFTGARVEQQFACVVGDLQLPDLSAPSVSFQKLVEAGKASLGPYGAYVDLVASLTTAVTQLATVSYDYIPAIGVRHGQGLQLFLSRTPTFQGNRKPVIFYSLPDERSAVPSITATPRGGVCPRDARLTIPVEGPVYATEYVHGWALKLTPRSPGFFAEKSSDASARPTESDGMIAIPGEPDKTSGAIVFEGRPLKNVPPGSYTAKLAARWGFEPFPEIGPFDVDNPAPAAWDIPPDDRLALVAGRKVVTVHFRAPNVHCIGGVTLDGASETPISGTALSSADGHVAATFDLSGAKPGDVRFRVQRLNLGGVPEIVRAQMYGEPPAVDSVVAHQGDREVEIAGRGLNQITKLTIVGIEFVPTGAVEASAPTMRLATGQRIPAGAPTKSQAMIRLVDARQFSVAATIAPSRPVAVVAAVNYAFKGPIALAGPNIPTGATVEVRFRSVKPYSFSNLKSVQFRRKPDSEPSTDTAIGQVDRATGKDSAILADGTSLTVVSHQMAVARFTPDKLLGRDVWGTLQYRVVDAVAQASDWSDVADYVFVRLPELLSLACDDRGCELRGGKSHFIASVKVGADKLPSRGCPGKLDCVALPPAAAQGFSLELEDVPDTFAPVDLDQLTK